MNAANTADLYQMVGSQRPVRGRMRKSKREICRAEGLQEGKGLSGGRGLPQGKALPETNAPIRP